MSKVLITFAAGLLLLPVLCFAGKPAANPPAPALPAPQFHTTKDPLADKMAYVVAVRRYNRAMVNYWDQQARLRRSQPRKG